MGTQLQPSQLNSPGKDIESYLSSVHSIPILTKEEEQELALKLYEEDDLDAARQLVIHHLRFVVHIARSYQGYGLPLGDIIQEGNVGLMKAVDKYDPHRGVKLVSFAVHWIKAEIHEYILKNWRLVKIATTKAQRKLFFNLRSKKKSLDWLSKEEAEKIASEAQTIYNQLYGQGTSIPIEEIVENMIQISNEGFKNETDIDRKYQVKTLGVLIKNINFALEVQQLKPSADVMVLLSNNNRELELLRDVVQTGGTSTDSYKALKQLYGKPLGQGMKQLTMFEDLLDVREFLSEYRILSRQKREEARTRRNQAKYKNNPNP